jgi:hypothetical protein
MLFETPRQFAMAFCVGAILRASLAVSQLIASPAFSGENRRERGQRSMNPTGMRFAFQDAARRAPSRRRVNTEAAIRDLCRQQSNG